MDFEFDPAKDAENIAKHGLSFVEFAGFDTEPVVVPDDRNDYGERRLRAFGRIGGKGHCLAFTMRGTTVRLISLRRAHDKELHGYGL